MENKKGGDLICMRPDSIVEARFNLTKKQNDIMDMVFATIENDDKLQYEIDVSKYAKLYNMQDKSNVYGDLKKAVKTFEGKGFSITQNISEKKQNRIYFSWFSSIQYLDGEGKIVVELGQTLKKLLLEVKRAVYYKLEYSINFNCIYSKRLYYYLKLYEDTGTRIDSVDTLREKLECPASYKKYSLFKQNVLQPAYEEINGNSDISFEYEEIKTKNKVTGIKFIIKTNKRKVIDEVSVTIEETKEEKAIKQIMALMSDHDITFLEAKKIYDSSKGNLEVINKVYQDKKNCESDNFVGLMISLVKPGAYIEPRKSHKTDSFNQMSDKHNYDFKDIENKLLGWDNSEQKTE